MLLYDHPYCCSFRVLSFRLALSYIHLLLCLSRMTIANDAPLPTASYKRHLPARYDLLCYFLFLPIVKLPTLLETASRASWKTLRAWLSRLELDELSYHHQSHANKRQELWSWPILFAMPVPPRNWPS